MPYNDRVIGQHVPGVLAVGPAFDDAAHPCRLDCSTGRVSFSEGVPHLSCGSPLLAIHPFGLRPSLGFTASWLTDCLSSGYVMSDNAGQMCCHRPVGMILIDPAGLFMSKPGSNAPTRPEQQATPPPIGPQGGIRGSSTVGVGPTLLACSPESSWCFLQQPTPWSTGLQGESGAS